MENNNLDVLSYNTERGYLCIPEYGRNIQNMIEYAKGIESREERNRAAHAIIGVMGQINPHLRDVEDYNHKLWTHLFVMSSFELDVDSPYPKPIPEKLAEKPKEMPYPTQSGKYGHFGYYAEKMIEKVSASDDAEEQAYMKELLGNLLKKDYLTFHTQNVENVAIARHLKELSKGKLILDDPDILVSTKTLLKQIGEQSNTVKKTKKKKNNNNKRRRKQN